MINRKMKLAFFLREALRKPFSVFMTLVILLISTASVIPQIPSSTEAEPYLLPGERALPLKSVSIDGQRYSLYLITTNNSLISAHDQVFFMREVKYWESHGITAVLAFDQNHNLIKEENLLLRIFQAQIGGYFQVPQSLTPSLLPISDELIADMSSFSKKPAFSLAFIAQRVTSVFKLDTPAQQYAELIRMIISKQDQISADFAKDAASNLKNSFGSTKSVLSETLKMEKYANNKTLRALAKELDEKYLDKWTEQTTPLGKKLKIDSIEISVPNYFELFELFINLISMEHIGPERIAVFNDLVKAAKAGEIILSSDLIEAIETVNDEVNHPTERMADIFFQFVKDQGGDLAYDLTEDAFRKLVTNAIWDQFGTRVTGHLLAGAFSSVFLGFSIANVLYDMDGIYENITNTETAARITKEFNDNINQYRGKLPENATEYPEISETLRKLAIAWNLSMAQGYSSYADALDGARLLKIITRVLNMEWDTAIKEFRNYAQNGIRDTELFLIDPELLRYAVGLPTKRVYQSLPPSQYPSNSSSTVLILDSSGSMEEYDNTNIPKIDAARKALTQIINVISSENSAGGNINRVGVASYNHTATVQAVLSSDLGSLHGIIQAIMPNGRTAMADGLKTGMDLFDTANEKKVLILLSDGLPNIGLNSTSLSDINQIKQEVIDLAVEAGNRDICVYTIGFGDPRLGPNSIDEAFLADVASASGCGSYFTALNSISLANIYVELRHASMGDVIFKQEGKISQGEQIDLGEIAVASGQETLLFTLNWPGSELTPIFTDPNGTVVDPNYASALVSVTSSLVSMVLNSPLPGNWHLSILGTSVPEGITDYNALVSTRVTTSSIKKTTGSGAFSAPIIIGILVVAAVGLYVYTIKLRKKGGASIGGQSVHGTLFGVSGTYSNRTINLHDGFVIGRKSSANLVLPESNVSRAHTQLRYSGGQWYLQDLESQGGTLVNGLQVDACRLNSGDQIQIGSNLFKFIS